MLTGLWNDATGELTVDRGNGQPYVRKQPVVTAAGHVFGVIAVGSEIHVLVGPNRNTRPNCRLRFSDANVYLGTVYGA